LVEVGFEQTAWRLYEIKRIKGKAKIGNLIDFPLALAFFLPIFRKK
jgi:hypothetical protein